MKLVKVSDQLHEKLKELAEKRNMSINQLIEEILNVYLYGTTGKTIKR
jgi:Ribbon-helix-helix protein, copG family.